MERTDNQTLRQKWLDYFNECDRIKKKYKKWYRKEYARITKEWSQNCMINHKVIPPDYPPEWPELPPFPDELRGLA